MKAIAVWQGLLVVLLGLGTLYGNDLIASVKEFLIFWLIADFVVLGADDRMWYAIEKPLTVVFYLGAILILLSYRTTLPTAAGQYGSVDAATRYSGSMATSFVGLISSGTFLGVWGVVRPQAGPWRVAQMLAPFFQFLINVGLFQFRNSACFAILLVVSLLVFRPMLELRLRPGTNAVLLAASTIVVLLFLHSDSYEYFMRRSFETTKKDPIFGSRLRELSAYTSDMGWEITLGRGLGGSFDASGIDEFIGIDTAQTWRTLHLGILVLTLKGGILMLVLFLTFILPGFTLRPRVWYQNPCNLTAALIFPLFVLSVIVAPMVLIPTAAFQYLPFMMAAGRFARRTEGPLGKQPRTTSRCRSSELAEWAYVR